MERKVIGVFACLVVLIAMPAMGQSDCEDAVTINFPGSVMLDPCSDTTPTGMATMGACTSGGGLNDVWAKFIATQADIRVRTDLGSVGTDSDYTIYYVDGTSTDCDMDSWWFIQGGCSEDENAYLGDITLHGLQVGGLYYIALGGWADSCSGAYNLTLEDPPPVPTLPEWGLLGLGVLLLGGGAVVFGRLRFVA